MMAGLQCMPLQRESHSFVILKNLHFFTRVEKGKDSLCLVGLRQCEVPSLMSQSRGKPHSSDPGRNKQQGDRRQDLVCPLCPPQTGGWSPGPRRPAAPPGPEPGRWPVSRRKINTYLQEQMHTNIFFFFPMWQKKKKKRWEVC